MRAAIYLRVSTTGQTGNDHVSLTVQEENCRAAVLRLGGDVVAVFRDEGRSGLDIDRPAYLQLFELAKAGKIDVVMTYRLDRFGRDAAELLQAAKRLRAFGVQILSATEAVENSLVAGIIALLAEDESSRIRARTVPALISRLREGKWVSSAPTGYVLTPHPTGGVYLVPGPDAWKVRRLFELYAEGKHSLRDLAKESEILEIKGKGLDRTTLSRLLRNPVYLGRAVWGFKQTRHPTVDDPRRSTRRPRNEVQDFEGLHEALVTQEIFDKVQSMLGYNKIRQGPPPSTRQLLIGHLRCGECGSPLYADRTIHSYGTYYNYVCTGKRETPGSCTQPGLSARKADAIVKERMVATFSLRHPEAVEKAEALIRGERDGYLEGLAQRKIHLERSLRRQESDQRNLTRKLARGVVTERAYTQAYQEIETLAASIRAELSDLQHVRVPDVAAALHMIAAVEWQDLETEDWRELIEALVDRIVLHQKQVEVTWTPEAAALSRVLIAATV